LSQRPLITRIETYGREHLDEGVDLLVVLASLSLLVEEDEDDQVFFCNGFDI